MRIETYQDLQSAVERLTHRTPASMAKFIAALRISSRRHSRRQGTEHEVGQRLDYILDAVETLILPVSPHAAFDLLVLAVERDGDAMEQCGDDDFSIETAVRRAAELLAVAAKSIPTREVKAALQRLVAEDRYGTRESLVALDAQIGIE